MPEHVVDHTDHDVEIAVKALLGYDDIVSKNPKESRVPRRGCRIRFYGLCCANDSDVLAFVRDAVFNVHALLKRWGLKRGSKEWPLLVRWSVLGAHGAADTSEYFVVTDDIGKGECQVLLQLRPVNDVLLRLESTIDAHHRNIPVASFSHGVFANLLRCVAVRRHVEPKDLTQMHLTVFNREVCDDVQYLQFRRGTVMREAPFPIKHKLGIRRPRPETVPVKLPFGFTWVPEPTVEIDSDDQVQEVQEAPSDSDSESEESSDALSVSDDPESDPEPQPEPKAKPKAVPKPVLPVPKPKPRGIIGYSEVLRKPQVAMCLACDTNIHVGNFRWAYRTHKHSSFDRYCHTVPGCALRSIEGHKEPSIVYLESILADPDRHPPNVVAAATALIPVLRVKKHVGTCIYRIYLLFYYYYY